MASALKAQNVTLKIVNENTNITDPWVTFIQTVQAVRNPDDSGTTSYLGPLLNATSGSTTLQNGVSYQLSSLDNNTISLAPDWAGNLFFSSGNLSSVLGQSGQNPAPPPTVPPFSQSPFLPTDPNGTITSDKMSYNYIEFAGGSSASINPDITYINYYSVPIQMKRISDGVTRGTPKSQAALNNLQSKLAAVPINTANTIINAADGGIARIVSSDNSNAADFPSFQNYVNDSFGAGAKPIQLSNQYSGQQGGSGPTATQTYTGSSVSFNGTTLIITGSSSDSSVGNYTITWSGAASDLSESIYAAVLSDYSVVWASGSKSNGNTGDNDVFSTITRDLLAGYNYGFINSDAIPLAGGNTAIGDLTSQQWMTLSGADGFTHAQPSNSYYNPWAAGIATTFTDVYSFPFNDYLSGFSPELTINTGDTLQIKLLGATAVPEPATVWMLSAGAALLLLKRRRDLGVFLELVSNGLRLQGKVGIFRRRLARIMSLRIRAVRAK
jgi:hypothetical protein